MADWKIIFDVYTPITKKQRSVRSVIVLGTDLWFSHIWLPNTKWRVHIGIRKRSNSSFRNIFRRAFKSNLFSSERERDEVYHEFYYTEKSKFLLSFMFLNKLYKRHRAQWFDNTSVVSGGGDIKSSEACTISDNSGKFECVDITPLLDNHAYGVSFVVLNAFCAWIISLWNSIIASKCWTSTLLFLFSALTEIW